MKKFVLAASVMTALFAAQASAASDNTVTFKGEVTSETCSVTINGNAVKPIVLLPAVNVSDLAASGKIAGQTTFDIGVTGCKGSSTADTVVSSDFAANSGTTAGNLGNVAATDAATNVEVQILDTAGAEIDFSQGSFSGAGDLTIKQGEDSASATYTAQYFATGAATAGAVEASMQYAVSYN